MYTNVNLKCEVYWNRSIASEMMFKASPYTVGAVPPFRPSRKRRKPLVWIYSSKLILVILRMIFEGLMLLRSLMEHIFQGLKPFRCPSCLARIPRTSTLRVTLVYPII